jgi:DNA (cytosine-5)-methyltransferase 1
MTKTFASLFTGGGLADIGAMQAGYELLWGVELDPAIAAVANANLPHREGVYAESVICIDWAKMTRPDHLHMSPPCQDYSVAKTSGKVGNDNDALATACIEALTALEPSTVTLENVEGYRKAPGFQAIVDHLWGTGYWVNVDVLNSADMGVPQTRRRLILRAVKGGFPGPLPPQVKRQGWYEAIEDLIPGLPDSQFAAWQLERLPSQLDKSFMVHPTDQRTMPVVTGDRPSFTLTTNQGGNLIKAFVIDDQYNGDPDENGRRGLTIRADAEPMFTVSATQTKRSIRAQVGGRVVAFNTQAFCRIQTLPDWYQGATTKIIGNGVPCLMMQRVLESLQ